MSLTDKLLQEHKKIISSITLIPSSNGIYDIYFNESRIFSKNEKGDFPGLGEVESLVRSYINNKTN